jgi:AraC-like DNA-binding protein
MEFFLSSAKSASALGTSTFGGNAFASGEVIRYKDALEKISASLALDDIPGIYNAAAALCSFPFPAGETAPGFDSLECGASLNLALLSYITRRDIAESVRDEPTLRLFLEGAGNGLSMERIEQFVILAERLIRTNRQEHRRARDALTDRLLSYIRTHLDADLSLYALSEQVYLNPSYLSRRFKEINGKNIADTVADIRIAEASRLLRETNQKINRIAAQVGYESAANFTRLFKRKTGATPQEFRDGLYDSGEMEQNTQSGK